MVPCLILPHVQVQKEWQNNLAGNCFTLPLTCLILFAYLVEYKTVALAKVLFWIGAPASLAVSFIRVSGYMCLKTCWTSGCVSVQMTLIYKYRQFHQIPETIPLGLGRMAISVHKTLVNHDDS